MADQRLVMRPCTKPECIFAAAGFGLSLLLWVGWMVCLPGPAWGDDHPAQVGWRLDCAQAQDWTLIDGDARWTVDEAGPIEIHVPARQSATLRLIVEPVWVNRFSQAKVRYLFAEPYADDASAQLILSGAMVGPLTPGEEDRWPRLEISQVLDPNKAAPLAIDLSSGHNDVPLDQVLLALKAGSQPLRFSLRALTVANPAFEPDRWLSAHSIQPATASNLDRAWQPVQLPETDMALADHCVAFPTGEWVKAGGLIFQLNDNASFLTSSLPQRSRLRLPIQQRCSEIALLMGADIAGSAHPFRYEPYSHVDAPERLQVVKTYEDGTVEKSFPLAIDSGAYTIANRALQAYAIPVNANKRLASIAVEEYMPDGLLVLAGLSVNIRETRRIEWPNQHYPQRVAPEPPLISQSTPTVSVEDQRRVVIANDIFSFGIDAQAGVWVNDLRYVPEEAPLLREPSPLFALIHEGELLTSRAWQVHRTEADQDQVRLFMRPMREGLPLEAMLTLSAGQTGVLQMAMRLANRGATPQRVRLLFPALEGVRLSADWAADAYFFPRKRAAWGHDSIDLSGVHSGAFPLQFFDLSTVDGSFGLAIHTRDLQLIPKRYRLQKAEGGSRMGIEYGFGQPLVIEAQTAFETPPTLLQFHRGDWFAAFKAYREWRRQAIPHSGAPKWLRGVMLSYRDYPLGGTGLVYDLGRDQYTFAENLQAMQQGWGGFALLELSGWAASSRYGRVGAYEAFELGGLDSLRANIAGTQAQGTGVALHVNGYLLDPRAPVAEEARPWRIFDADGEPKTRPGTGEWFMDPHAQAWRTHLSEAAANAASLTGASAVSLGQVGFGDESKRNALSPSGGRGPHPVRGEHRLLQTMRGAFDEMEGAIALLTEEAPADLSAPLVDGAFSYAMAGDRPYPSPASLNLFRYAFPEVKVIEQIAAGAMARALTPETAKRAFFHGEAVSLKGRARSWTSREFRRFLDKAGAILREHAALLVDGEATPLIPTEQAGLYANRFQASGRALYTLYNATPHTVRGSLLVVPGEREQVSDRWGMDEWATAAAGPGRVELFGSIHPYGVACVLVSESE